MAYKLEREKTQNTPYVLIDEEKRYLRLEGKCYLEDIVGFFKDIYHFVEDYLSKVSSDEINNNTVILTFDCEMSYFNSTTTKQLNNLLHLMDRHAKAKKKIVVNWICEENDEIVIEHGEDFQDILENLEFNLITR